jgi:3-deoxy-manno-octulosonate cytidylyltransferase (CMP-KDO synthetase)
VLPVTFRDPFERTGQPPHVVAVIPARYTSTRLPGKPLADIAGRPMIEHVYRRAVEARGVDAVIVATDDDRIRVAVEGFGGIVRMTASTHRSGTDRIAEAVRELPCDIVVNVQGDLPLVEPGMIADVVRAIDSDVVQMATVCRRIDDVAEYMNPNVVKVVRDARGDALYFSRAPIPHLRNRGSVRWLLFKHIGLYAYRREFLLRFAAMPPSSLEHAESLEQLRALEYGHRIRTVETEYESIEVDTPEDLERVRRMLAAPA